MISSYCQSGICVGRFARKCISDLITSATGVSVGLGGADGTNDADRPDGAGVPEGPGVPGGAGVADGLLSASLVSPSASPVIITGSDG